MRSNENKKKKKANQSFVKKSFYLGLPVLDVMFSVYKISGVSK